MVNIKLRKRITLQEYLLKNNYIKEKQLKTFIDSDENFVKLILSKNIITENKLAEIFAEIYNTQRVYNIEKHVNKEYAREIGKETLEKYSFLPLSEEKDIVEIVIDDPTNIKNIDEIKLVLDTKILFFIAPKSEIVNIINLEFSIKNTLDETVDTMNVIESSSSSDQIHVVKENENNPVIKLVNSVVIDAIDKRASDIHFEPYENIVKVRYRVDGVLFDAINDIGIGSHNLIVTRIKVISELNIAETRIPQDGRFKMKIKDRIVDFRVSILPSIFGETIVIRVLDKQALSLNLSNLGFESEQLSSFSKTSRCPYGMILVSGPTGSGKTTTLYSVLKTINRKEDKVITIEDPVEYQIPGIVQVAVNEKKGLTFSKGLRSIVRQDPDKIMVGEIRDVETAEIAINAALTGHLVLSTIHSNNVVDSISRILNMEIDPYQIASAFNLIVAQRLVRKICPNCKEILPYDDVSYNKLKVEKLYYGKGCKLCNDSGYFDRVGIFEMLILSSKYKQMIIDRVSPIEMRKTSIQDGMISLRKSALLKIKKGITTLPEANRVTYEE